MNVLNHNVIWVMVIFLSTAHFVSGPSHEEINGLIGSDKKKCNDYCCCTLLQDRTISAECNLNPERPTYFSFLSNCTETDTGDHVTKLHLFINHSNIEDLEFNQFERLKELYIRINSTDDPSILKFNANLFSQMTNLRQFVMQNSKPVQIEGNFLNGLKNLETIDCENTTLHGWNTFLNLSNFKKLQYVNLWNTSVNVSSDLFNHFLEIKVKGTIVNSEINGLIEYPGKEKCNDYCYCTLHQDCTVSAECKLNPGNMPNFRFKSNCSETNTGAHVTKLHLFIDNPNVEDLDFKQFERLEELYILVNNDPSKILKFNANLFSKMTNLRQFVMQNSKPVQIEGNFLDGLNNLETIDCENTTLHRWNSFLNLSNFKKLQYVNLWNTSVNVTSCLFKRFPEIKFRGTIVNSETEDCNNKESKNNGVISPLLIVFILGIITTFIIVVGVVFKVFKYNKSDNRPEGRVSDSVNPLLTDDLPVIQ